MKRRREPTNKEKVLARHPTAKSWLSGDPFWWCIFNDQRTIGAGSTPQRAWADAAARLERKP